MSEKKLRDHIVKIRVTAAVLSLLLLFFSGIAILFMVLAERSSYTAQMQAFVNEYKINVERQYDSDLESLETLAAFISNHWLEALEGRTDNGSGSQGAFLRLGYCEKDTDKITISLTKNMGQDLLLEEQSPKVQEIVKAAWEGEVRISRMYSDESFGQQVIAYCVPVYDGDVVTGALLGVKSLEVFEEILNNATLSQISMDVDWINSKGEYIMSSENSIIKDSTENIFDMPYISEENKAAIKRQMSKGRAFTSNFRRDGKTYPLYFEPLDQNGWYLVCTDRTSEIKSPVYFRFVIVVFTFVVVIVLSIVSILYGSRFLRKNHKTLLELAYYDPLTGAYNLPKFREEAGELLNADSKYSVVLLNIRHFQYMNEIFGREGADQLLRSFYDVLRDSLKEGECCCRYMADEFYVLIHSQNISEIRERIGKIMEKAGTLGSSIQKNYPVYLYAGAAVNQEQKSGDQNGSRTGTMEEHLIHNAEFALKHAREETGNALVFYDEGIYQADLFEKSIESHMEQALKEGEFKLFLQPKKNLRTGKIDSGEALVRWITKDGSMIYPDQFIPVFEKNGFCAVLDLYMVEQVCIQMRRWLDAGYAPVKVSVNQTKRLFYQSDYIDKLCKITERYNIPRESIVLEILEGLAAESIPELNKNISILHEKGFKISLDDFGTGYSSLNLLASLEIDEVKLDRGFLAYNGPENKKVEILMTNIIHLAGALHISTVVEGVETKEDESFISGMESDYGQGYYYSRPVPVADFEKWLESV